jgi:aspartyl protease family protein
MHFIFDTGAGLISISETETIFLYKQGKLTKDDIMGNANFNDANGDISEGTIINLKTVKLGNKILKNVEASVVHNLGAPLLIGQSALEKFEKISIDYQRGEITFE